MARLAFVDTHVHLYDLQLPNLHYSWMQPGVSHPVFGALEPIQAQRFWADDYIAEKSPDLTISLDHAGFPRERTPEYFGQWREALVDVAGAPNVVVKISGLGMGDTRWTVDSLRPWVLSCIEAFGVERSFFGTNWPVGRIFSSYPDVVNAYAEIIAGFTPDEQEAMFSRNAERIFRI